jgi:hypothetical protein
VIVVEASDDDNDRLCSSLPLGTKDSERNVCRGVVGLSSVCLAPVLIPWRRPNRILTWLARASACERGEREICLEALEESHQAC